MWEKHLDNSWFNENGFYAGKDHTKNNKTFICLNQFGEVINKNLKTLDDAKVYIDKLKESE